MTTAKLLIDLNARGDRLPSGARHALVAGVLGVHLAAGWALMRVDAVRQAVAQSAPLFVEMLAPPAPPAPPRPAPARPAPEIRRPIPKREPPPILAAAPTPSPEPPVFVAPPAPEPPAPSMVAPEPAPALPPPPPAPLPQPPEPKTIAPTAVRYLTPPAPVYPKQSEKLREAGRVLLRVEIGTDGRARQVLLARSSGFARLDDAATSAVRSARFAPYTENGIALVVWTQLPIEFELER